MYINKIHLAGRFTHTPGKYLQKLPSGTSVLNMTIAQNKTYKDTQGNKREESEFNEVVFFGKTAEIVAQYCEKGQEIYVEGHVKNDSYELRGAKKDDGSPVKVTRTKIVVENFQFGPKSSQRGENGESTNYQGKNATDGNFEPKNMGTIEYPTDDINPEDIPFN